MKVLFYICITSFIKNNPEEKTINNIVCDLLFVTNIKIKLIAFKIKTYGSLHSEVDCIKYEPRWN